MWKWFRIILSNINWLEIFWQLWLQLSFLFDFFSITNSTSKFTWSILWVLLSGNFDMFDSIFGSFQHISAFKSIKYPREPLKEFQQTPVSFFIQASTSVLNPCMKFKKILGQKHSFEALWKWQQEKIFTTCPRVRQIQDLCRKKYKKGIF